MTGSKALRQEHKNQRSFVEDLLKYDANAPRAFCENREERGRGFTEGME